MELTKLKLTKRRSELLEKIGVQSVEDVLRIYPLRYETIKAVPFSQWKAGDPVAFEGLIASNAKVSYFSKNRSVTTFIVITWNEEIRISLFNRPWKQQFTFGKTITCFGTYQGNHRVVINQYHFKPLQEGIRPVYPLQEGIRQSDMTAITDAALVYADRMTSFVPEELIRKYRLMDHGQVLKGIHRPADEQQLQLAIRTLKYEEFLLFQCVMQSLHRRDLEKEKKPKVFELEKVDAFMASLPYACTQDQQKAIEDVLSDLRSNRVMFRLVQGDVGCGKTTVAAVALYAASLAGVQSCFLAPTEILARQHVKSLRDKGLTAELYVSNLPAAERKRIREGLEDHSIDLVVGTHALFQEAVSFADLGFVIVDEQQRFGVRQRQALLEKGNDVDLLMMSATPIPRTFSHFLFGDLDLSDIHTLPPGRKKGRTRYVKGHSMGPFLKEILGFVQQGRQGYVVCPSIEENEKASLRSVLSVYEGMKKTLPKLSVGLLHGKMSTQEKEETMQRFVDKEISILVSTTVIEVGIDVPDATWMVIYDADRFGLSTLHQLRGRVMRGTIGGECFLLSDTENEKAVERLQMLETCDDGFTLTEYDLSLRGPGDVLGFRQSGLPGFLFADLNKDKKMMECCIEDARAVLAKEGNEPLKQLVARALEKAAYFD